MNCAAWFHIKYGNSRSLTGQAAAASASRPG